MLETAASINGRRQCGLSLRPGSLIIFATMHSHAATTGGGRLFIWLPGYSNNSSINRLSARCSMRLVLLLIQPGHQPTETRQTEIRSLVRSHRGRRPRQNQAGSLQISGRISLKLPLFAIASQYFEKRRSSCTVEKSISLFDRISYGG